MTEEHSSLLLAFTFDNVLCSVPSTWPDEVLMPIVVFIRFVYICELYCSCDVMHKIKSFLNLNYRLSTLKSLDFMVFSRSEE
jgi:hypothetical protein